MPENFKSLRYPEDLGTSASPNYVTFSPRETVYGETNYGNPVDRGSGGLFGGGGGGGLDIDFGAGNPFKQIAKGIGGQLESLADAALDSIDAIASIFEPGSLSGKATAFGKVVNGQVRIGDFILSSGIKTTAPQINTQGSISLYLPQQLTSNTAANYENKELGVTGQTAIEQASMSDLVGADGLGKVASAIVGETVKRSGQIGDVLAIREGAIVNPYTYQVFGGMSHRQFSYQFDFVPKNAKEAREVANICDMFLYYMLPSKGGGVFDNSAMRDQFIESNKANLKAGEGPTNSAAIESKHFLKMPSTWEITYWRDGNSLTHIQQPNPCFLDSCNITYGGDTQNLLHTDGSPVKTSIELSFTEIEPQVRR